MKPNSALLKLIIKLLILIILFILIFIISTVLYSARYWPDIYNYVNANITIKRIPTLSEITVAEIEYTTEFTTEFDYIDSTTEGYEYFEVNDVNSKEKREVNIDIAGDYSEVPEKGVLVEYVFIDEPTTVNVGKVPDLIGDSEIGARDFKDVDFLDGHHRIVEELERYSRSKSDEESADLNVVSAWIVTVFVKNTTANSQFDYVCDGALISNQHVLTGARCTVHANATFKPDDVIVIVGKKSLQGSGGNEKAVRVTEIHRHDNFTIVNGKVSNELAVLKLDEIVYVNDDVQIANISTDEFGDSDKSLTTAWAFSGELKAVYFEKVENGSCADGELENVLCATYGNEVALCPSYGGLYAVKVENDWFLRGIRSGDPAERGICFIKRIDYTTLDNYLDWINQFLEK